MSVGCDPRNTAVGLMACSIDRHLLHPSVRLGHIS